MGACRVSMRLYSPISLNKTSILRILENVICNEGYCVLPEMTKSPFKIASRHLVAASPLAERSANTASKWTFTPARKRRHQHKLGARWDGIRPSPPSATGASSTQVCEAVHLRHVEVGNDQVSGSQGERLQRVLAIGHVSEVDEAQRLQRRIGRRRSSRLRGDFLRLGGFFSQIAEGMVRCENSVWLLNHQRA